MGSGTFRIRHQICLKGKHQVISSGRDSNVKGNDARIVLEGPGDILFEHALIFEFTANNNQEEHEDIIVDMVLALEMGACRLKEKNNS